MSGSLLPAVLRAVFYPCYVHIIHRWLQEPSWKQAYNKICRWHGHRQSAPKWWEGPKWFYCVVWGSLLKEEQRTCSLTLGKICLFLSSQSLPISQSELSAPINIWAQSLMTNCTGSKILIPSIPKHSRLFLLGKFNFLLLIWINQSWLCFTDHLLNLF